MASNPNDPNHAGCRVDWRHTEFETRAICAGQDPDDEHLPSTGHRPAQRLRVFPHGSPTRTALQASIASLKGGAREIATLVNLGDRILMSADAYDRTFRLFMLAENLRGVESLIEHPDTMTHALVAETEQAVDGVVIRLSVGIEHAQDLIDDLAQALDR